MFIFVILDNKFRILFGAIPRFSAISVMSYLLVETSSTKTPYKDCGFLLFLAKNRAKMARTFPALKCWSLS